MGIEISTDRIKALLDAKDRQGIIDLLSPLHPSDVASLFSALEEGERVEVFKLLSPEVASRVLLEVDEHTRELLIASISRRELIEVVDEMATDDAADVIAELPVEEAQTVLEGIGWEEATEVQKLLKYPDDTAGGLMQTELVAVNEDATVQETIDEVRAKSEEVTNIHTVFVIDGEGRLVGNIPLDRLILAKPQLPVRGVMNPSPIKVTVEVDQEEVAKVFQRYDMLSLPVVDKEGRLMGRVTIDDVVDVIEEEIFEDFYRMAGLSTDERVMDRPTRSFRLRAPWLLINLLTAFVAASVVRIFQDTIQAMVTLAVFMPVVAGMGGNAATQTITVVVRGLALGELEMRHAKRVLIKEVMVGCANGILTGVLAAVIAYTFGVNPKIGVLLCMAMVANLVIAGLSGTVIPVVLKWFKADPAIASSIFVTTFTDVGGFFSFLGLATLFMRYGFLQ